MEIQIVPNSRTAQKQQCQHQPVIAVAEGAGIVMRNHDKNNRQGHIVVVQTPQTRRLGKAGIQSRAIHKGLHHFAVRRDNHKKHIPGHQGSQHGPHVHIGSSGTKQLGQHIRQQHHQHKTHH